MPYAFQSVVRREQLGRSQTDVATSEVSTLQHELWDHAVELGTLIAEALLARSQSPEVLGGLWDDVVEKIEVDATGLL